MSFSFALEKPLFAILLMIILYHHLPGLLAKSDEFNFIITQSNSRTKTSLEIASSIKLLEIHINDQLNFNLHIINICESTSKQLSALVRLKCF